MKPLALGLCLTSLLVLAACGDDEPTTTTPAAASGTATSTTTSAPAGGVTQLIGTVGKEGEPDAFVISLTDGAGQPVTTLPAGSYSMTLKDLSKIHNFHFKGPRPADFSTRVPEVEQKTFQVRLTPGTYSYVCDPHPKMTGQLTVT